MHSLQVLQMQLEQCLAVVCHAKRVNLRKAGEGEGVYITVHGSAQRKRGGSSVCLPCVWMSPKGTGELHPALSRVDTGHDDGSDLDTHGIAGHGECTHIYGWCATRYTE